MRFFLALIAHSQTNQFRLDMLKRPRIELVIAHLVLFHGLRRARFRGLAKVDYQMKMGAMAYNAKRLLSLLAAKKREQAPSGVATVTLPGRTLSTA
jgi:IS5 family transposase